MSRDSSSSASHWRITSGALAALHTVLPSRVDGVEATVLVAANLLATVVRFVLLRGWVFHPRRNH